MSRIERATKKFCAVRDSISQVSHPQAYRNAFGKPLMFYEQHSKHESITILLNETEGKQ